MKKSVDAVQGGEGCGVNRVEDYQYTTGQNTLRSTVRNTQLHQVQLQSRPGKWEAWGCTQHAARSTQQTTGTRQQAQGRGYLPSA